MGIDDQLAQSRRSQAVPANHGNVRLTEANRPPAGRIETGRITTGRIIAERQSRGSPPPAAGNFPSARRHGSDLIFIGMIALGCLTAGLAMILGAF